MSPRRRFAIVFIEGFCSLGAEVIALRQIVPHMGSSIVVTCFRTPAARPPQVYIDERHAADFDVARRPAQ